jgi:hypothetical protein
MEGQLQKLKVIGYSDPQFNNQVDDGEFNVLINPENYSFKYRIEQTNTQAPGTSAAAPRFNKILPQELAFNFIFDNTGAVSGTTPSDDGVVNDIESFKRIVLDYEGETHRPNYVKISWGTLLFKGTLTEMEIAFRLFKPDGTPIRANANAKFRGFVEDNLRVARENAQSPDLTHMRMVKEGDTLPLMAYKIYGDSKYYIEVARVNKLTDFRNIVAGSSLLFPPIDKTAKTR